MGDTIKKVVDDTKDAVNEVSHRTNAEVERAKRDVAGDEMSAGEKVKSVVKEGSERTKAEIDKVKREVRDRT
jgi:gas vesicle protein